MIKYNIKLVGVGLVAFSREMIRCMYRTVNVTQNLFKNKAVS